MQPRRPRRPAAKPKPPLNCSAQTNTEDKESISLSPLTSARRLAHKQQRLGLGSPAPFRRRPSTPAISTLRRIAVARLTPLPRCLPRHGAAKKIRIEEQAWWKEGAAAVLVGSGSAGEAWPRCIASSFFCCLCVRGELPIPSIHRLHFPYLCACAAGECVECGCRGISSHPSIESHHRTGLRRPSLAVIRPK